MQSHKDRKIVEGAPWQGLVEEFVPMLSVQVDYPNRICPLHLPCGLQMKLMDGLIGKEGALKGRLVTPEVDLELLKGWLGVCTADHEDICKPAKVIDNTEGAAIRAIDIETMCIVDLPSEAEYAALSYVWGPTKQLRLLQGNYEEFNRPFGLTTQV